MRRPVVVGLAGVLLMYFALGFLNVWMLPRYRPADEPRHAAYAILLWEGRWPVMSDPLPLDKLHTRRLNSGNVIAAANHPPLYYWLVGGTLKSASDANTMDAGIRKARLITLGLGGIALLYVFSAIRRFFPRHLGVALTGAAFVATIPAYINTCSIVYNDALGVLTATAAMDGALGLWFSGLARRRVAGVAIWMALAVFTRLSGLFVVGPALVLAFAATFKHSSGSCGLRALKAVAMGALLTSVIAAVSGWFYLRNYRIYGDVTGASEALRLFGRRSNGSPWTLLNTRTLWAKIQIDLWVRLAGGIRLRNLPVWLSRAVTFLPLLALPKLLFDLRGRLEGARADARLVPLGVSCLAFFCVVIPMFLFHARGGNLNARYALPIIWLPAMIVGVCLACTRSSLLPRAGVLAFASVTLLTMERYGRALVPRPKGDLGPNLALAANGAPFPAASWLTLAAVLGGAALVMFALGRLHVRVDQAPPVSVAPETA